MQQMRKDLKMKMAKRNMYKDMAANGIMGITSLKAKELKEKQKQLTVPSSPNLPTTHRYGQKKCGGQGVQSTLAQRNPNPISSATNSPTHSITVVPASPASSVASSRNLEPTIPQPFNLSSSTRKAPSAAAPRTPPVAELISNFTKSLHSVSRSSLKISRGGNTAARQALTSAISPQVSILLEYYLFTTPCA